MVNHASIKCRLNFVAYYTWPGNMVQRLVLQISRLSEGSTGQIFATSSVIYQMKMWGLWVLKVVDDTSDSEY